MIERELLRKHFYNRLRQWILQITGIQKFKDVSHMLLRFRFNLIPEHKEDPIFCSSFNLYADQQFLYDLAYFQSKGNHENILKQMKASIINYSKTIVATIVPLDQEVRIQGNQLIYKEFKFTDLRELGRIHPHAAVALQIRYQYLRLDNHGAARMDYMEHKKSDQAEGFASAFNHYFDEYCSCFPDLEYYFGSQGSFWEQKEFVSPIVQVNPPFDATVIKRAVEKVVEMLNEGATNQFVFTVPHWKEFEALNLLRSSIFFQKEVLYEKGTLLFKNHMTADTLYPCDIIEILLHAPHKRLKLEKETI